MTAIALLVASLASSPLAERHRVFLEDEAHFLMTLDERARFAAFESDASRDRFIEAFWSVRDRETHHERLAACDRLFSPRGRWSERGRMYQLLGPPSSREDFARAGNRIVDSELWHYTGLGVSFLPDSFYLVFFRRGGAGELRLWHPQADGVAALVLSSEPGAFGMGVDPALDAIDPELALAVESLVPGGSARDAQSLLTNLDGFAELAARARVFGERVSGEVAMRELASRLVVAVFPDDAGVRELHYALELAPGASRYFTWREVDDRLRARVSLIARLVGTRDERERWEDTIELDVTTAERAALKDMRLVVRGRRIVQADDVRFELALVTAGAGTVVGARVDHVANLNETAFDNEVNGASSGSSRVLVRERTPSEESRYRFVRGSSLAQRGERDRAVEEFQRAAELDASNVRVHLELARLLYASGRYREILSVLGETETRFADVVDAWVMMAAASAAMGRHQDAVGFYDRALSLAPDDAAIATERKRLVGQSQKR